MAILFILMISIFYSNISKCILFKRSYSLKLSKYNYNYLFQNYEKSLRSISLTAKRNKKTTEEDIPAIRTDPGWVTFKLDEATSKELDQLLDHSMDDRIKKAEQFVTKRISSKESAVIDKKLAIETQVLTAIATENDQDDNMQDNNDRKNLLSSKVPKNMKSTKKSILTSQEALQKLKGQFETEEYKDTIKMKGFLELNPQLCSGCGTAFQSKTPDNPGYLPKDKFQEHKKRSELIREQQDAIKILEMAGIDVDSQAAIDMLREGNISEEVINGVKILAKKLKITHKNSDLDAILRDYDDGNNEQEEGDYYNNKKKESSNNNNHIKDIENNKKADILQMPEFFDLEAYNNRYNNLTGMKNKSKPSIPKNSKSTTVTTTSTLQSQEQQQRLQPEELPLSEEDDVITTCICQRCFRLQQYGQIEESLRPGWSDNELLTPERFEGLLGTIKDTPAVVLCLVDIFDLRGSLLSNLKTIVGNNPLIIAANKIDLLPKDASMVRLTNWIHTEVKHICGYKSPAVRGTARDEFTPDEQDILRQSSVHLVSCHTGLGMDKLLGDLMSTAKQNENKIFVMGAANVGKSSFINRLLETSNMRQKSVKKGVKVSAKDVPMATVSNLPGTTLDFLKIKLPNGVVMIDTPGLLNKGQLTSKLTTAELRQVIPAKPINSVTLRLSEGKCVLVGGLAILDQIEGRPFLFTFFVSNEIKIHPTSSEKALEFIEKHIGGLIDPPSTSARYQDIGPFVTQDFVIAGEGWEKSSYDIVIAGLGWIAVTGSGEVKVRLTIPEGTEVSLRPSLLPFESRRTAVKFTGGIVIRKTIKPTKK